MSRARSTASSPARVGRLVKDEGDAGTKGYAAEAINLEDDEVQFFPFESKMNSPFTIGRKEFLYIFKY